jgi:universal stress protein A
MQNYQHILLTADYSEHGATVASKAKTLALLYQAKLSIIHVLDNIPMPDTHYGTLIALDQASDDSLLEAEKNRFIQLCGRLAIEPANRWLVWGVPKQEIIERARQENVDLIVVGSHERHGLALLLGTTANSVLHHAPCDVLAVHLP